MQTSQEYIDKLWELYPREEETSLEIIEFADEAVQKFPDSEELWILRGHLILLAGEDCPHDLDEALKSYKNSVEINPNFIKGWEEIGHFYDAVMPDKKLSKRAFDKANQIKSE